MIQLTRLLIFGLFLLSGLFVSPLASQSAEAGTIEISSPTNASGSPVVYVGQNKTVRVGKLVMLHGLSRTSGVRPPSFIWTISSKPSGSTTVLNNARSVVATLIPDVPGAYVIGLVVTDTGGTIIPIGEITIQATDAPASYYIDYGQGADSNACTKEQPCKHVPGSPTYSGSIVLKAGDTVYFKRGETYGEFVGWRAIPTVPGVTYTVDPTFTTDPSNDTLKAVINGRGNENIFWIDGNNVKISGVDSRRLLRLEGPVSRQAIAYVGQGGQTLSSTTIEYLEITVKNTNSGSNGMGIRVGDGSDGQAITGGEIRHNLIYDCGGYGIKVSAGKSGASGIAIHDNEVFGCGGGAGLDSNINISSEAGTIDLDFHHNKVHNPSSPAYSNVFINNPGIMVHDNELYGSSDSNLILNPGSGPGTATGKVYNNIIRGAGLRGIHIGQSNAGQGYVIYNNLFMGNSMIGIYFQEDAAAVYTVVNNTVYCGSGEVAVKFWPKNNNINIRNNILYTQNAVCIYCESTPGANSVDYNVHYRADGGDRGWYATTSNAIAADPLFETSQPSPVTGVPADFKITFGSPARDSGQARSELRDDYFGATRPFGANWDIGFHECTATAPAPGTLAISPSDGFSSSGPQGGPFNPSNKAYTLQNTGNSAIDWTASNSQIWNTLSAKNGSLEPGATTTIIVSLDANGLTVGSYSDTITFTNLTNGEGTATRPANLNVLAAARSDLIVSDLSVPSAAPRGTRITVTDSTTNSGSATAPATITRFYLSSNSTWDSNDTLLASRSVPSLTTGATSAGSTSLTIPSGTSPGTWYVIARADATDVVAETDEANNTRYGGITVTTGRPDLIVSALTVPSTARRGTRITVTDSTTNSGTATARGSYTRFYLSSNTTWESTDRYLGSRYVPSLTTGATSAGSTSLTIPSGTSLGTWYVIARADATNTVNEANETNNTSYKAIAIGR